MLDFLWSWGTCPLCRAWGARVAPWGRIKCRRSSCANFDEETERREPPSMKDAPARPLKGDFKPGDKALELRYVNFRGQEKTFTVDRSTVRAKGEHVSARAAPTGKRLSFGKKWLRNLVDVQGLAAKTAASDAVWASLSLVERQIVGYHRKHKSTSARYEAILSKHPGLREGA
jgi:hypothetical protein